MRQRAVWVLLLIVVLTAVATEAGPFRTPRQGDPAGETLRAIMGTRSSVVNFKEGCTASKNCPLGGSVSCSSGVPGTCSVGNYWVNCNGNFQQCPIACFAEKECCDGSWAYCEGYSTCSQIPRGVKCDGISYAVCPPLWQCAEF
jgi:hypothetical protein